jgi:hypothetical protein
VSETDTLELIGAELKRQIAATFDAQWKDQVRQLVDSADREYGILSAFTNELAETLGRLRSFPARYRTMQGRTVAGVISRYRSKAEEPQEPVMTEEQRLRIRAETAARSPGFAKMVNGNG